MSEKSKFQQSRIMLTDTIFKVLPIDNLGVKLRD